MFVNKDGRSAQTAGTFDSPVVSVNPPARASRSLGDRDLIGKSSIAGLHPRRVIGSETNPYRVGSSLLSDQWSSYSPSSIHATVGGRISDNWAGYITLGRYGNKPYAYGGLYYNSYYGRRCYPYQYWPYSYYHGYDSIWSYNPYWYRPCYGYAYASVYWPYPYYYRNNYTDVYIYDYDDDYADAYSSDAVYYGDGGSVTYVEGAAAESPAYSQDATGAETGPPAYAAPAQTLPSEEEAGQYQDLAAPGEDSLIGRGNAAFTAGQYDEARKFYITAVMADERDGYAKFLYAVSNFGAGDYEVAGLSLRRALLTTPALVEYPPDARALYPDQSVLKSQLGALEQHVLANPTDRNAPLLLGYLEFAVGEPLRAAATLEPLVTQDAADTAAAMVRDAALRAAK